MSKYLDDLRRLGHKRAADELQALAALRKAGPGGVRTEKIPGWPATTTRLNNKGYSIHCTGSMSTFRVHLRGEPNA